MEARKVCAGEETKIEQSASSFTASRHPASYYSRGHSHLNLPLVGGVAPRRLDDGHHH
jgi:hypothetical protein